jgi:hypothetical protein
VAGVAPASDTKPGLPQGYLETRRTDRAVNGTHCLFYAGVQPKNSTDATKGSSSTSSDAPQREPRNKSNARRNTTLLARGTDHLQIGHFHKKVFFRLPSRSGTVLFVVCCNCASHGYPMVHVLWEIDGRTAQSVNLATLGFYRVLIRLIALSQAAGHRGCVHRVGLPTSKLGTDNTVATTALAQANDILESISYLR